MLSSFAFKFNLRSYTNAGASGAEAAAAVRANNVNVEPLGDLKTQANDPYVWPSGYCLACHVIGLNSRNDISSAVNDVASDMCLTTPLGAGRYARFRGHCAEGCRGRGGSAVQLGLPVSE